MAYALKQYNHSEAKDNDNVFMTEVKQGQALRRPVIADRGVTGGDDDYFKDECVKIEGGLQAGVTYYFSGKIKRLNSNQTFDIKLVQYDDKDVKSKEQFIKTIDIHSSPNSGDWAAIEFMFTPVSDFDTILFELYRIKKDYQENETRFPTILYEELSKVNNIIGSLIESTGTVFEKIGVQGRSHLMMCINGEQIATGRSGVYELRNGIVKVSFFSVIAKASLDANYLNTVLDVAALAGEDTEDVTSKCLFSANKTRTIPSFTLDYMYKKGVS